VVKRLDRSHCADITFAERHMHNLPPSHRRIHCGQNGPSV
jgi:hypothetical protein